MSTSDGAVVVVEVESDVLAGVTPLLTPKLAANVGGMLRELVGPFVTLLVALLVAEDVPALFSAAFSCL